MKRRDFLQRSVILAGLSIPTFARAQTKPCPPVLHGTNGAQSCDAEADWILRTSGPGVVWHHDFRSEAEVNNFRWSGGVGGGNDPDAVGENATWLSRDTSDGITGAGCLSLFRAAGSGEGSIWWRPFSPLVGSGNGKGQDDPAAANSLIVRGYNPTQGSGAINNHNFGWYGHSSYHNTGDFDGEEFWLQLRVKRDLRRLDADLSVGKSIQLGVAYDSGGGASLTSQTVVTYSALSPFRMYAYWEGTGATPMNQQGTGDGTIQPGGVSDIWEYSGGWDCLMYHVVPGREGFTETVMEVYAAHPGETEFTKIWADTYLMAHYDHGLGMQAVYLSTYQNNQSSASEWVDKYDQIIFSKEFIPCPQV